MKSARAPRGAGLGPVRSRGPRQRLFPFGRPGVRASGGRGLRTGRCRVAPGVNLSFSLTETRVNFNRLRRPYGGQFFQRHHAGRMNLPVPRAAGIGFRPPFAVRPSPSPVSDPRLFGTTRGRLGADARGALTRERSKIDACLWVATLCVMGRRVLRSRLNL